MRIQIWGIFSRLSLLALSSAISSIAERLWELGTRIVEAGPIGGSRGSVHHPDGRERGEGGRSAPPPAGAGLRDGGAGRQTAIRDLQRRRGGGAGTLAVLRQAQRNGKCGARIRRGVDAGRCRRLGIGGCRPGARAVRWGGTDPKRGCAIQIVSTRSILILKMITFSTELTF